MSETAPPAYMVIPALAMQWPRDPAGTIDKFREFIVWHAAHNHRVTTAMYRCALVQLLYGAEVDRLHGFGFDDKRLSAEAGA